MGGCALRATFQQGTWSKSYDFLFIFSTAGIDRNVKIYMGKEKSPWSDRFFILFIYSLAQDPNLTETDLAKDNFVPVGAKTLINVCFDRRESRLIDTSSYSNLQIGLHRPCLLICLAKPRSNGEKNKCCEFVSQSPSMRLVLLCSQGKREIRKKRRRERVRLLHMHGSRFVVRCTLYTSRAKEKRTQRRARAIIMAAVDTPSLSQVSNARHICHLISSPREPSNTSPFSLQFTPLRHHYIFLPAARRVWK